MGGSGVTGEGDAVEIACNMLDDSHCTPLHLACIQGNARNIYRLVERGARATSVGLNGMTPLHMCAAAGHIDAVQTLLHLVPASEVFQRNAVGMNAKMLAEVRGHHEVVEVLDRWARMHGRAR